MRILVVEDDTRLSALVRRGLRAEGYGVDSAPSGLDGRWLAFENDYDGIVLDTTLADADGFRICEDLRAAGRWTPVLMLTPHDAVDDRVRGLDVGADDCLGKPFTYAELSARVRALIRRGVHERPPVLRLGVVALDPAARSASLEGRRLDLSPREFALLELFLRRPDEVLSRTEILEHVWDWAYHGTSNVVDVYVGYLRRKLGQRPGVPRIEAIRGVGYVMRTPGLAAGAARPVVDRKEPE